MRIENDKITDSVIMLCCVIVELNYYEIIAIRIIFMQCIIKSNLVDEVDTEDSATTSPLPLSSLSDKHHKELLFLSLVHSITCAH